jgi:hypothetical protein
MVVSCHGLVTHRVMRLGRHRATDVPCDIAHAILSKALIFMSFFFALMSTPPGRWISQGWPSGLPDRRTRANPWTIRAKSGIQRGGTPWIPAFAGMTVQWAFLRERLRRPGGMRSRLRLA